jgi:hypothetical protein
MEIMDDASFFGYDGAARPGAIQVSIPIGFSLPALSPTR